MIVHKNGISRIEGFAGDDLEHLASIGEAIVAGAARGRPFAEEKSAHVFSFDPATLRSGKFFRFVVRETALSNGYAIYQAFPRLADKSRVTGLKQLSSWIGFCQSLFNLNEFAYIY